MTSRARARGFTLIELLVAMSVLLLLGVMMVALMSSALATWNAAERQRKVYTRARAVFSCLAEDFEAALTRDPPGSPVRARMFCEPDPKTGRQVLMLTRTFGTGAERGYAFAAGDGLDTVGAYAQGGKPRADDEDLDPRNGRADEEIYNFQDDDGDGHIDEDLSPLGGSAQVAYLHEGRELKRAVRSPAGDEFASMFRGKQAQTVAGDVLYFSLLFATPYSSTWDESVPKLPGKEYVGNRGFGPERLWDSTRGVIEGFSFHVGPESLADGEDDVFPELVRVTLVIEPHQLRTVRTDLREEVSESGGLIQVASTRGFPPPKTETSYVLVDDEWMYYEAMTGRSFTVKRRGRRGTARAGHLRGAPVRCGRTFVRTFYLPGYRNEEAVSGDRRR